MKKVIKITAIIAGVFFLFILGLIIVGTVTGQGKLSLPVRNKEAFKYSGEGQFPTRLKVKGAQIINTKGQPIIFKGLMAPDPGRLDYRKLFERKYYEGIREQGANAIRVPVHPDLWKNDKDYLWRYLDLIVTWAGEMNMYVVIDWHYIGNISTGEGQEMPDIKENPKEFSKAFWKKTAKYFKDAPNVIFEVFNEPASIGAGEWNKNAVELVKTIRDTGAEQLIIVGGIDYSYDLSWVEENPIADGNLAYAAHVFPMRNQSEWQYYFGDLAKKYPVLVTEWGYIDENRGKTKQTYLIGDENTFGKPLLEYLHKNGIGWIAAWYDDEWEAQMFTKEYKSPTNFGEFVFNALRE